MPTHAEIRPMPYAPEQMYALIADIDRYPEFLPWVAAVRERARRTEDGPAGPVEIIEADLIVSFKVFRERFGSRVTLRRDELKIDVAYLDGPFRYLDNHWEFRPREGGGADVDFFVDFEFKSPILRRVIGAVFYEAMKRIVQAFETRADALYGPPPAALRPGE
ncbi:MAG: type II toxin-antitoxin system RatA family toxin [Pseudomonadota bacterium]